MNKITKKFIGPRMVTEVTVDEQVKTYGGNEVVVVNYDGGYKETMTKKTYDLLVSQEPSDFTKIREKKFKSIYEDFYPMLCKFLSSVVKTDEEKKQARLSFIQDCLAVFSEYDLKVSEVSPLLDPVFSEVNIIINALANELDNYFNRATNFLWTRDDAQFVPGVNIMNERTMIEAKKISETIPLVKKDEGK
jgi:hypothetical protein